MAILTYLSTQNWTFLPKYLSSSFKKSNSYFCWLILDIARSNAFVKSVIFALFVLYCFLQNLNTTSFTWNETTCAIGSTLFFSHISVVFVAVLCSLEAASLKLGEKIWSCPDPKDAYNFDCFTMSPSTHLILTEIIFQAILSLFLTLHCDKQSKCVKIYFPHAVFRLPE